MEPMHNSERKPSLITANVYRLMVLLGIALLMGGAFTVPFYYETQTLWYKVGPGKIMLRAGQLAGMLTLVLLMLQIIVAQRASFIENLFGSARLMRWHRINGVLIVCAAMTHVALVLVPEGLDNLPIGKKYWPEMIGALLFLLIFITVVLSYCRSLLHMDYATWRMLHRPSGYIALVLVFFHVLFVSESFTHAVPKALLLTVFAGLALFAGIVQRRRWQSKS
jgi:predicted ferric reductase